MGRGQSSPARRIQAERLATIDTHPEASRILEDELRSRTLKHGCHCARGVDEASRAGRNWRRGEGLPDHGRPIDGTSIDHMLLYCGDPFTWWPSVAAEVPPAEAAVGR